jgi:hypothetical protein
MALPLSALGKACAKQLKKPLGVGAPKKKSSTFSDIDGNTPFAHLMRAMLVCYTKKAWWCAKR